MSTRRTDAFSAAAVTVVVLALGKARGHEPADLFRPRAFLSGIGCALLLEAGFARWPVRARRLWRRPVVRFSSPVLLVVGVIAADRNARRRGGDAAEVAPFAGVLGGLAGYFMLLAGIGSGLVPEPATWFDTCDTEADSE